MSVNARGEKPIGEALASIFKPALSPLGFELASVADDGVQFEGAMVRFEARYVPLDGELAVYVIPRETGERLQLHMYLRAIKSSAASKLGDAVAESAEVALRIAETYAAALPEATTVLNGEASELDRARTARLWGAPPV